MSRTVTCSGLSTRAFAICSMSSFIAPPNSFCALVCRSGIRTGARCARFLCDLGFTGCSWRCLGVRFSRLSTHLLAFEFLCQFTLEALLFPGFRKKGVLLHLIDNALLLNLSFEMPKALSMIFAILCVFACCISDFPLDHRSVPITQTLEITIIYVPVARSTGNAPG